MKLRVRLAKQHMARYMSHLDLQRTLERILRRAGLPLAYTQGFTPHPKISFASALATGAGSEGEFVDVDLTEPVTPEEFMARANQFCSPGVAVVEARVAPPKGDSLFSLIDAAEYRLTLLVPSAVGAEAVEAAVRAFLGAAEVAVAKETKRGVQTVNIREQVFQLAVEGVLPEPGTDNVLVNLRAVLQSGSQGSLKPELLLTGLAQAAPALAAVTLVGTHRLMLYRQNPQTGALEEPWYL